jgi:hypothetical protein
MPGRQKLMTQLEVECWGFWSPEADDPSAWLKYWQRPDAQPAERDPPAELIPPMQRRRSSRLTKMALTTALQVANDEPFDYSIFCSQHGEIVRTWNILSSINSGTEISPTAFSQSVHNTSSGLFTILQSSNAASMSMASGANSFAHGWLEAQAYLAGNPTHRVLLVDFDEVLPEEYQPYNVMTNCEHSLAMSLRLADKGGIRLTSSTPGDVSRLPQGPQFLAWLQAGDASLSLTSDGLGWRWER